MKKSTVFVLSFSKKDSLTSFVRTFINLIKSFYTGEFTKVVGEVCFLYNKLLFKEQGFFN